MKLELLSVESICTNRDSINNYFAWPTVTRLKDGRLAMVASGFRVTHICPFGKSIVCYSSDEGKTWSQPAILIDSPLDDRDTGIVAFGESSVMVTTFNDGMKSYRNYVELEKSENYTSYANYMSSYLDVVEEKKDWRKYEGALCRISHDNGATFGPIINMPIKSPHGPAVLADGNLLWIGDHYDPAKDSIEDVLQCYKVFPDGNYEYQGEIEDIGIAHQCEPHAIVLESGKIIVHIRMGGIMGERMGMTIYQSESYDGGKTFTKPHSIGLENTSGGPAHIIEHNGLLISVYGHREEGNNLIRAMFSRDEGETWEVDYIVAKLPDYHCDIGYPASVALEDGSILTVFYGEDEGYAETTHYVLGGVNVEFTVPVIRQAIWRYCDEE